MALAPSSATIGQHTLTNRAPFRQLNTKGTFQHLLVYENLLQGVRTYSAGRKERGVHFLSYEVPRPHEPRSERTRRAEATWKLELLLMYGERRMSTRLATMLHVGRPMANSLSMDLSIPAR